MLDLSIIIPFKNKADMTIACLESLQKFGQPVKQILLVSNNSETDELKKVQDACRPYSNAKVLVYDLPFNFQAINNWAARQAKGKVLLLLNNDIELTAASTDVLGAMFKRALDPKVGGVGAVLVYEDGDTIQHGGVYLVAGGTADHLYIGRSYKRLRSELVHSTRLFDIRRDTKVTAVTAAAVMIEKRKFDSIEGMNEAFIICGGDVDLCLRLKASGFETIMVGADSGLMVHKESKSRSMLAVPYVDFVESYKSYSEHFDIKNGDLYVTQQEIAYAK